MSQQADPRVIVDQAEYWNSEAGRKWVARQEGQDVTLGPLGRAAMERAAVKAGESVIDIGCGCGATTLELARRVGAQGRVLGIDISHPMLARAKERAKATPQVTLVEADATTHAFEPGRADLLFSRLGVMFFPEPARAFANLRRALKPGGRLAFVCFRTPKDNPFLMTALAAATLHVPPLPKMEPDAPGPFAFADDARVKRILGEAGFADVKHEPVDIDLDIGSGKGFDEAMINAVEIGPASRALTGQPADLRAKAEAAIRQALKAHEKDGKVLLTAKVWIVTAKQG
ncbi:MAG TPA: class I SAM-dependent methyltransferase [Candidatus Binatia bacterium]|nr:class I SAM-dependent methyltransferase [Candidatus Binatia bacterium]